MFKLTIKRVGELLRCVFEILWNKPDGLTAKEVLSLIPEITQLTEDELRHSPTENLPRYERIVRLATIPLARAGWLIKNEKGRWYITEDGRQACRRFSNAEDLYKEAMRLYEERRQANPESVMILETAQESAWEQIEKYLHQLKQIELQTMTAELLRAMDYYPAWIAPPEKQHGQIDLIAYADPLGAKGQRIKAQVRQKGQAVTLEGVRSFLSALEPNDIGVIFSTGGFTNEAAQELSAGNFQKLTALDAGAFFDLWKEHYSLLNQEARHLLPLKTVHFLSVVE
jgi:restriction system protein